MAVEGRFMFKYKTPIGEQKNSVNFIPDGESVKGVFESIVSMNKFTDCQVDEDDFTFSLKTKTQMGMSTSEVKVSIKDEIITGVIKTNAGAVPFKGYREV